MFQVDERLGINGITKREVLPTGGLLEADNEILSQNGISAPVSEDLRGVYAREAPADDVNVTTWLASLRALRKCVTKKRERAEE